METASERRELPSRKVLRSWHGGKRPRTATHLANSLKTHSVPCDRKTSVNFYTDAVTVEEDGNKWIKERSVRAQSRCSQQPSASRRWRGALRITASFPAWAAGGYSEDAPASNVQTNPTFVALLHRITE